MLDPLPQAQGEAGLTAGPSQPPRLLVIGVGNRVRGDDAVGPFVADLLRAATPDGVHVREESGDSAGLLAAWAGADDVIVVDAVASGAPPGTVHVIDARDGTVPAAAPGSSTHGLGLAEAIALGRALGRLPARCTIYGIEGSRFTVGADLTAEVARAGVEVAARIRIAAGGG